MLQPCNISNLCGCKIDIKWQKQLSALVELSLQSQLNDFPGNIDLYLWVLWQNASVIVFFANGNSKFKLCNILLLSELCFSIHMKDLNVFSIWHSCFACKIAALCLDCVFPDVLEVFQAYNISPPCNLPSQLKLSSLYKCLSSILLPREQEMKKQGIQAFSIERKLEKNK